MGYQVNGSAEKTIYAIVYTRRNAADILQSKGVRFSLIKQITIQDPDQIWIDIVYSTQGIDSRLRVSGIEFLALAWADRMQRSSGYRAVPMAMGQQNQQDQTNSAVGRGSQGIATGMGIVIGVGCTSQSGSHWDDQEEDKPQCWGSIDADAVPFPDQEGQTACIACVVEPLPEAFPSSGQAYQVTVEASGVLSCTCPDYANQQATLQEHPALWRSIREQPRCKHLLAAAGALKRADLLQMPVAMAVSSELVTAASDPTVAADAGGAQWQKQPARF